MKLLITKLLVVCLIAVVAPPSSFGSEKLPLRVLYLSRQNDESRTTSFADFLAEKFASCKTVGRDDFTSDNLDGIDVVLLDWSQSERASREYKSPIGPLEKWTTPTVLLGSAGLLIAKPWNVIGDAG